MEETLGKYDVQLEQVYSNTTDNAGNMLKCSSLMDEEVSGFISDNQDTGEDSDDEEFTDELTALVTDSAKQLSSSVNTTRCGSQSLALSVERGVKSLEPEKEVLIKTRKVVKKLRGKKNVMQDISAAGFRNVENTAASPKTGQED